MDHGGRAYNFASCGREGAAMRALLIKFVKSDGFLLLLAGACFVVAAAFGWLVWVELR
jgi:hypothetical protein